MITPLKGKVPIQHFKENSPCAVHIHLLAVHLPSHYLWRHVVGGPRIGPHHLIVGKLAGESEISYFDPTILEEYISGFEITVDDLEVMHGGDPQ